MFGQSGHSRAKSVNFGEIERRLRSIEERLERVGVSTSASAVDTADHVGHIIASALKGTANRFREGAHSVNDKAVNMGSEAAKLGNDALRRLSEEIEHRPLVTLAVAVGAGFLLGLSTTVIGSRPGRQTVETRGQSRIDGSQSGCERSDRLR